MYQAIIVVHVLLGLGVVGLVLIQQGKGADAGAAFGSASSGTVFGAQGAASFLSRATAILAALFFSTSLGLAIIIGNDQEDVDLMDTADTIEVFADVPLVNGVAGLPSSADALPVIKEELPSVKVEEAGASIQEEVNSVVETLEAELPQ